MLLQPKTVAFGLDIGGESVKIAEIKRAKNIKGEESLVLTSINKVPLDHHAILNGEIKNPTLVIEAIKKCVKTARGRFLKTAAIVLSIPESQSYYKVIKMPQDKQACDIYKFLEGVLSKHFPIENNDLYFDWQLLSKEVMAVAGASKNIIDSYTNVIEQSGLIPIAMETESAAITRALVSNSVKTNAVFMDLGASHSSIIVVQNNYPIFTLSIPLSGNTMSEEISRLQKIPFEKAEEIKLSCGFDIKKCGPKTQKILNNIILSSTQQIKTGLQYIEKYLKHKPKKIYICGGVSLTSKIAVMLSEKLKVKFRRANPLINIKVDKNLETKDIELLKYTTAIGLAIRGTE